MRIAAVLGLCCLLLAGSAAAARRPTAREGKALRSAIRGFITMPNSPSAEDNRIFTLRVSTLDERYAAAQLRSPTVGAADLVLHESMGTWFVEEFGSSLGCDAAPKAVLDDLKVGCTPPGSSAWLWDCGPLVARPRSVVLTCADANYQLVALRWRGWGRATAAASGKARANDCDPSCAAGHFHSYVVDVTASRVRRCGRARVYTRLAVEYPGVRPQGIARRDVHALAC